MIDVIYAHNFNKIRQKTNLQIVLEREKFKPKLNLRYNFWKRPGLPVMDVSVTEES